MTNRIEPAQQTAGRITRFACLIAMASAVFAHYGIHARSLLGGNAEETARNIMAHERLFRIIIARNLICGAGGAVLLTALYLILEPVNRSVALMAAFSGT